MANPENTPIEHTVEELMRLRAENRSLAAELYLAKKEVQDLRELLTDVFLGSGIVSTETLQDIKKALNPKP